jgi:hypothetical protein
MKLTSVSDFHNLSIGDVVDSPFFGNGIVHAAYFQNGTFKIRAAFVVNPGGNVEPFIIEGLTYNEYMGFDFETLAN